MLCGTIIFILQPFESVGWHLRHTFLYTWLTGYRWKTNLEQEQRLGFVISPTPILTFILKQATWPALPSCVRWEPCFLMLGKHFSPWDSFTSIIQLYKKGKAALRNLNSGGKKSIFVYLCKRNFNLKKWVFLPWNDRNLLQTALCCF